MFVFVLLGAVVIVAGVGLRRRTKEKETEKEEEKDRSADPAASASGGYSSSLLVPCLVGLVLFGIYYGVTPGRLRTLVLPSQCRPPTPQERAAEWDYLHTTDDLRNVSGSHVAQTLFNQGLLWKWGFLMEASEIAFSDAIKEDPICAMCYWGASYSVSPFVNIVALPAGTRFPHYSDQMNRDGRRYLKMADSLSKRSKKESDYIEAMWIRFPEMKHVTREHQEWVEFLYGAKMLTIFKEDPTDLIAGSLVAESFANVIPWDYYDVESTKPQPLIDGITWEGLIEMSFPSRDWKGFTSTTGLQLKDRVLDGLPLKTEEDKVRDHRMRPLGRVIEHLLLKILEADASHPMATHLHVHLTEAAMANDPRKGLRSANNLATVSRQWPVGHLQHMPSHTYLRVGEYRKGVEVNELAHRTDIRTSGTCMDPYVPEHNVELLVACASMGGLFDVAEKHALESRKMKNVIKFTKYMSPGWDYVGVLNVWGQFGKWEKILSTEAPFFGARGTSASGGTEYAKAMYHYYRNLADAEFEIFRIEVAKVGPTSKTIPGAGIGIYASANYEKSQIAMLYAQARNATLNGNTATAIAHVEHILKIVKDLGYMEPPWTQQAPKQCLAYLLLHDKQYEKSRKAYEEDLGENPRNPWSTLGLAQVFAAMDMRQNADTLMTKYDKSGSSDLGCSCPMLQMNGMD